MTAAEKAALGDEEALESSDLNIQQEQLPGDTIIQGELQYSSPQISQDQPYLRAEPQTDNFSAAACGNTGVSRDGMASIMPAFWRIRGVPPDDEILLNTGQTPCQAFGQQQSHQELAAPSLEGTFLVQS